jgi:hypothetical protein
MFLYEENYYDAVRLYVELSKLYDKTTETDKINSIYLKIADIFMNMKQSSYKGSEDVDFIKKVDEQLKSWYDSRFSIAQGYYDKANMSNEGYTKIGKFLCDNHNFVLCIESYEKLEDVKESKGLIIEAQRNGAVYYFEKAGESYKSLSQLAKDEGDWNLITENFNNSVEFLEKSKNFYKKLRDYKKLRKIQKIERQLKRYKKTLGLK